MKENYELYEHVYQDAEMACYTLKKLMDDLRDKDNKIKGLIEEIFEEYQEWRDTSSENLKENGIDLKEKGMLDKMMASMGIKKEVLADNSDSSIADMLIQGVSMGSIDTEKKLNAYDNEVEKDQLKFVKDFLKFQEKAIDKLKKYL